MLAEMYEGFSFYYVLSEWSEQMTVDRLMKYCQTPHHHVTVTPLHTLCDNLHSNQKNHLHNIHVWVRNCWLVILNIFKVNYKNILYCLIFRSISWGVVFKTWKYAWTRFSNQFTFNCCFDSFICIQQTFDSIVVAQSFYDLSTMYTFITSSKHP